jgi:hypothetical protein
VIEFGLVGQLAFQQQVSDLLELGFFSQFFDIEAAVG